VADNASPYRDARRRTLDEYPRPSVAVDTAVLTVPEGAGLSVLVTLPKDAVRGGPHRWRLPGTFLHPGELLSDAVLRSLREKAGVTGLRPRQLRVFDAPGRDDRGWVVSVAHLDAVRAESIPLTEHTRLVPVEALPALDFDHAEIVGTAVVALRADYRRGPDPAGLLPAGPFTVRDLRTLHERVLDEMHPADTFRRTMLPALRTTGEFRRGARGKPAELYRRVIELD
jgi:8-oxo-dGTP diphosphatase